MSATWDEVRVRSECMMGSLKVYCGDCGTAFPLSGLPCRRHSTPEESAAIDDLIKRTLREIKLPAHQDRARPVSGEPPR